MIALAAIALGMVALYAYGRYRVSRAERRYPPTGEFVVAEGLRLHYRSRGEGRPIVYLHGGVLTGDDFKEAIELAAAEGYRGIAFDRPGYGYSERPRNGKVTPNAQARLLRKALIELGVDKPILVCHSWSGVLALAYALEYPDELSGIVGLGGGFYPEGYPAEKGDPVSSLITTPVIGALALHTLLPVLGPPLADSILKQTFKPESVPESYRLATRALWLRPSAFKANREDVLAFVPAAREMADRYREIRTPLVLAVGEDDPFETREHSFRLHREVPGSDLLVLPGVGHMIPQLHPEAVMLAIKRLDGQAANASRELPPAVIKSIGASEPSR
ncbi:alpha/beta hydrolase [Cohnella xylanilytica]|uniref:alpha/beta fold hydrolase n=1 Tax=Cohnella xylanilytica TaxID=557555 RepID=UPI001B12C3D4|nr:alpha/beta hydrolase [Cohnella xylanilytica]GIO13671.1 alpha/beta hydrolase [Cohnella xylanilytica]